MRRFVFIVCSFCMVLCGCQNSICDSYPPAVMELELLFINNEGKNVLDSLLAEEIDYVAVDSFCTISCTRQSDRTDLYLGRGCGTIYPRGLHATGKGMHISWEEEMITNIAGHYPVGRAEEYDETYQVNLSSPVLFGDSTIHTVRIHVHVKGLRYGYRRTEVDGKAIEEERELKEYEMWPVSVIFVVP